MSIHPENEWLLNSDQLSRLAGKEPIIAHQPWFNTNLAPVWAPQTLIHLRDERTHRKEEESNKSELMDSAAGWRNMRRLSTEGNWELMVWMGVEWSTSLCAVKDKSHLGQFPFWPGSISAVVVRPALFIHMFYPLTTQTSVSFQEKGKLPHLMQRSLT